MTDKTAKSGGKHKFELNEEKLAQLKKNAKLVRTGGKGAVRRVRKVTREDQGAAEDNKVVRQLKRFGCQPVQEIEEAVFFLEDDKAKVFTNPRVHHAPGRGLFVISGASETKNAEEVQSSAGGANAQLAQLLQQLNLGKAGEAPKFGEEEDADIPETESFDV